MDILDRLLGHDAWTTREMLLRCQHLSDEQLDRRFPIGHESLRATFHHIIWNMEAWTDVMYGRRRRDEPPAASRSITTLIERLDSVAADFAALARCIRDDGRIDDLFTDPVDDPLVMRPYGAGIAHVITHSMHHRAQVLNMMRHLGMTDLLEGDSLTWERLHRPGGWPRQSDLAPAAAPPADVNPS